MPLSRTIYFSENKIGPVGRDAQMAELQKVAVIRNRRHHVTGALAYDNRWFAQALEGETRFVLEAFDRILRDTRHANVRVTSSGLVSDVYSGNGRWASLLVISRPSCCSDCIGSMRTAIPKSCLKRT